MTPSEHTLLHNKLRKKGKCNIPVEELTKISVAAHERTDKRKAYNKSDRRIKLNNRAKSTDRAKKLKKEYHKKNIFEFAFLDVVGVNVSHRERIFYNKNTGTITISCGFISHKLKQI